MGRSNKAVLNPLSLTEAKHGGSQKDSDAAGRTPFPMACEAQWGRGGTLGAIRPVRGLPPLESLQGNRHGVHIRRRVLWSAATSTRGACRTNRSGVGASFLAVLNPLSLTEAKH